MTTTLDQSASVATLQLPASGRVALNQNTVEWFRTNEYPGLEARLLYTAEFVCDGLERYAFDHLSWMGQRPMLSTVAVEQTSEDLAEFRIGEAREFVPDSIFGFVPSKAFDQSSDVYLLSDANPTLYPGPKVVYVNAAFERMTGYASGEIIGQTPRLLQGPETCTETLSRMRERLTDWKPVDVEVTNYRRDGSPFRVQLDIVPITDSLGWYVYWFSKQIDITKERKEQIQREAVARKAGMAETATGVLHNVGNVLNSINTSSRLIRNKLESTKILASLKRSNQLLSDQREQILQATKLADSFGSFFDAMTHQATRDFESIEDELKSIDCNLEHLKSVISVQQIDAKEGSEFVDRVLVVDIVEQTLNICKGNLTPSIEISTSVETDRESLLVSKHQVLQILSNLVKNAAEALTDSEAERPQIGIYVYTEGDRFVFEVTDNGPGFENDTVDQLFAHGFSTKGRGSGFGLSTCAELAQSLGGELLAHSVGPGQGATFRLII